MSQVTTENIGTPIPEVQMHLDPSLVKVKVSYLAKYEDKKHMEEGRAYWMSREAADALIEKGIAEEVNRSQEENTESIITAAEPTISTKGKNSITETKK